MNNSFKELKIKEDIILGLSTESITTPTEIQKLCIPFGISGKDIIGHSPTGSGKTLAFVIPIIEKINYLENNIQAIILAPTHELVVQINKEIQTLSKNSNLKVKSTTILGNVNIKRQIEKLKEKPHIIVGTTGRILELIQMKKIKMHWVKTIVIDEYDKMIDENNINSVNQIIKTTLKDRQLMFFSATANESFISTAKDMMKTPEIITLSETFYTENIDHFYILCEERDKPDILRKVIASLKPDRTLVFINKNEKIQLLNSKLNYHHINSSQIFGNASKVERKKSIDEFKNGKTKILISSDLASRGLDIDDVTHIINLDISENLDDYTHRSGRTGRMGKNGTVISIINKKELSIIKKIENHLNIEIKPKKMYKGMFLDV